MDYNITEISPAAADATLARHLRCPAGSLLHYFDEVGYNPEHQPVLYSQEYYLPHAFSFKLVRKLTTQRRI